MRSVRLGEGFGGVVEETGKETGQVQVIGRRGGAGCLQVEWWIGRSQG